MVRGPPYEQSVADGSPLRPWLGRGEYLVNPSLVFPPTATRVGAAPPLLLGPYDTRPDEAPYEESVHQGMAPMAARDGVTLRMGIPSNITATAEAGGVVNFAAFWTGVPQQTATPFTVTGFNQWGCLVLYVGGFDFIEELNTFGMSGGHWWETSKPPGPDIGGIPNIINTTDDYYAGRNPRNSQFAGWQFMRRAFLKPRLDLLPYLASGMAEFDLLEIAGGCRYIWAAIEFQYIADNGVDWIATPVNQFWTIPYSVRPGRAIAAAHRNVWRFGVCKMMPFAGSTAALNVINPGYWVTFSPPYAGVGQMQIGGAGNGSYYGAAANLEGATMSIAASVTVSMPRTGYTLGALPAACRSPGLALIAGSSVNANGGDGRPNNPMMLTCTIHRGS